MNIVIKIANGKVDHAAQYDLETELIILYCNSLKMQNYYATVSDFTKPSVQNVTCKKCLRNKKYFS